jgi:hypothetical protein
MSELLAIIRTNESGEQMFQLHGELQRVSAARFPSLSRTLTERMSEPRILPPSTLWRMDMRKALLVAAVIGAVASPAFAEEVGVRVGPVGAGVTVGETRDHDRDRDRDRTTVIKEREPRDRTTVIKKEDEDGNRSKTIIHHDN